MRTSLEPVSNDHSRVFACSPKEDAEDRIPTSSSVQLTTQDEPMDHKRKKKLSIFQVPKPLRTVSLASEEETVISKKEAFHQMGCRQYQRIIQNCQSGNWGTEGQKGRGSRMPRKNKIFSKCVGVKRIKQSAQSKENDWYQPEAERRTKRIAKSIQTAMPRVSIDHSKESILLGKWEQSTGEMNINSEPMHRLPFTLFRTDSFSQLPSVSSDNHCKNTPNMENYLLSYPKFTPNQTEERHPIGSCPQMKISHFRQLCIDQTERDDFNLDREKDTHSNPASKKIKQPQHTKRKISQNVESSKPSNEKCFQTNHYPKPSANFRVEEVNYSNSVGSRLSNNISTRENKVGRSSLIDYNIKVTESFSSSECDDENERYFDHEDVQSYPFAQKISYRNIEIQHAEGGIDEIQEGRLHNLFSDFQCSRKKENQPSTAETPKKQGENSKELTIKQGKCSKKSTKWEIHFALIALAVMLLFIQILG